MLFIHSDTKLRYLIFYALITHNVGRKTKNGDVVCKRRWSYPCAFVIFKKNSSYSIDRAVSDKKKVSPPSRT